MASWPIGYRFHPTDDEIINHYLKLKSNGYDDLVDKFIGEIDLCKYEPWELPGLARVISDDRVWWFFCRPDYKYSHGQRVSRTTKTGFWKLTGKARYIKAKGKEEVIGSRRTLVFHLKACNSSTKAIRKNWVIHEYQAKMDDHNQGNFVVIKVKNKADEVSEHSPQGGGEPSLIRMPDIETRAAVEEPQDDEDELMNAIIASIGLDYNHPSSSPQSGVPSEHEFSLEDLLGANSFGNNDGASTSRSHANEDELELTAFANSFLNDPGSGTSWTLLDDYNQLGLVADNEPLYEQGLLENRNLSSPHHDLQRKEHGVESDDILVMGSGHEINRVEQLGEDDLIIGKIELQGGLSCSELTKKVNEVTKRRADVPHPKPPEKPKVSTYVRLVGGYTPPETPPSSHGQSPPPKKPEKPMAFRRASSRLLRVTSDSNSMTNVSTNNRRIGGFIQFETPPSSRGQNPPSVYIINVVVGVLLLVFCIWELLVRHW